MMTDTQLMPMPLPKPLPASSRWQRLRRVYVGTPGNALLTLLFGGLLLALPPLVRWTVIDAVWFDPDPASCRVASGACWNFIWAKLGQLLFGIYPFEQRWRPGVVCTLILALLVWSGRPASWRGSLGVLWLVALALVFWLMGGGLGLAAVPSALWGGLPVTLILTVVAIGLGLPLGVLLALGRRSAMPAVRLSCVVFIEGVRGLPLLSILFVVSIMLPLFLPVARCTAAGRAVAVDRFELR